jgi:hypothetical protein
LAELNVETEEFLDWERRLLSRASRLYSSAAVSHAPISVLAANANVRAEVVPKKPIKKGTQLPLFKPNEAGYLAPPPEPSRHSWPWLLKRVFAIDITVCPRCASRMRVIEVAKRRQRSSCSFRTRHQGQSSSVEVGRGPIRSSSALVDLRRLSDFSLRAEGFVRLKCRGKGRNAGVHAIDAFFGLR